MTACLVLAGCQGGGGSSAKSPPGDSTEASSGVETVAYKTMLSRNLANLNKLSAGMTKAEVVDTMETFHAKTPDSLVPNPYETEAFAVGATQYEVLYYMTRKYPPFTPIKRSQATPVVLKEGRVAGWGDEALQKARAGKE